MTSRDDETEEGLKHEQDRHENDKQESEASGNDETSGSVASLDDYISPDLQAQLWEQAQKEGREYHEAQVTDIHARRKAAELASEQIRLNMPDIIARARALQKEYPPDFKELRSVNSGGQQITAPLLTDLNIMEAFRTLFGSGTGRPYFDTFKGLSVGWNGKVIDDDFDLEPLVQAMHVFKMPMPRFERVEVLFRRFARQVKINSLIDRMNLMVPEWDRTPRMDMALIKLFGCFDTDLNRQFGRYFWLSIYNRAMFPGCNAPMVLALIGTQGAGKSYLGKLISEEMLGVPDADSVPLDWVGDFNIFLRKITGKSVVANVAEMAGFTRAELTKIKGLTTRTADVMDYKFERDIEQRRQWIMLMDGNEYAGLQRDETGNRRFYPMFVGQLPYDESGEVRWRDDYYVDYTHFRNDFWQLMAEAAYWMEKEGLHGYQQLVSATERAVKAFSAEEMRNDRGTIKDDDLDTYIAKAMAIVEPLFSRQTRDGHFNEDGVNVGGRVSYKKGAIIPASHMRDAVIRAAGKNIRVIPNHLKNKLTALGAKIDKYCGQRCYVFEKIVDRDEWTKYMQSIFGELYLHEKRRFGSSEPDEF
jgi:hypothetical protein